MVEVPASFPVSVTLPGGEIVAVDGRVAKMIEWQVQERGRIETMPYGAITFNVTPSSFQPKIERVFPRVEAKPNPE